MAKKSIRRQAQARLDRINQAAVDLHKEAAHQRFGCSCMGCMYRAHVIGTGAEDPGHSDEHAAFNCKQRETINACRTCGHSQKFHVTDDATFCTECECEAFLSMPHVVR